MGPIFDNNTTESFKRMLQKQAEGSPGSSSTILGRKTRRNRNAGYSEIGRTVGNKGHKKDRWYIMEWHLCHRSSCGSMFDFEVLRSLFVELDQVYEPYTIQPYSYASHAAILAGLAEALYGL